MGAALGQMTGTAGIYKVNHHNKNKYNNNNNSKSSDASLETKIKMLKQSRSKRFSKGQKAAKEAVSKPVMFYGCAHSLEVLLAMTGPQSRCMEYEPENVKEVESTMRDYIDLLENPTLDITPTQRKVAA